MTLRASVPLVSLVCLFAAACEPKPLAPPQAAERHTSDGAALTPEATKPPPPPPECPGTPDLTKLAGEPVTGEWVTTPSCLKYVVLRPGAGKQPKSRLSSVRAHYTGWLVDGTKFDSSVDRGKPFDFRLSQVVPGWTEAMLGMKEGEKRKLVIPYALAYGRDGHGNIPPKATLVFDVELLEVLVE
jgi:peptidylprolyl isomerase